MASKTGQVIYLKKGDPGQKGDRGPSLRGPMDWEKMATGFQFQCGAAGEDFLDVVIYGGKYYQCIVSHKKTATNYPGSNYNYWRVSSNLSFVATDLLLASSSAPRTATSLARTVRSRMSRFPALSAASCKACAQQVTRLC